MPAVSKAQQRFMGMVYAAKKGDMPNPSPEVAKAAESMKKKDAKDFASTKHKGLPEKKVTKEAIKITIRLNCNDFKAYLELVISRLHPSFSLHASKKSLSFKCTSFKGFSTFEISIFAL